ncbi:hypothetical protein JTB14_031142 [Gonioctena quinquepunctata]|nr:hypothetical protein JTB14_031142 [Gonioctena quinquepunctata]
MPKADAHINRNCHLTTENFLEVMIMEGKWKTYITIGYMKRRARRIDTERNTDQYCVDDYTNLYLKTSLCILRICILVSASRRCIKPGGNELKQLSVRRVHVPFQFWDHPNLCPASGGYSSHFRLLMPKFLEVDRDRAGTPAGSAISISISRSRFENGRLVNAVVDYRGTICYSETAMRLIGIEEFTGWGSSVTEVRPFDDG